MKKTQRELGPFPFERTVRLRVRSRQHRRIDVGATDEHADALILGRHISAGHERGEGRRAGRLTGDAKLIPERMLGRQDRLVGHEQRPVDPALCCREADFADA